MEKYSVIISSTKIRVWLKTQHFYYYHSSMLHAVLFIDKVDI